MKSVNVKPQNSKTYLTLMEYCPSDVNIEVEALKIAKQKKVFSVDDLHCLDPSLERMGLKHQVYGVAIRNLLKEGKIRFIRYVASNRSVAHYRPVGEYEYVWG